MNDASCCLVAKKTWDGAVEEKVVTLSQCHALFVFFTALA